MQIKLQKNSSRPLLYEEETVSLWDESYKSSIKMIDDLIFD